MSTLLGMGDREVVQAIDHLRNDIMILVDEQRKTNDLLMALGRLTRQLAEK